jgi:hypothetical protein
MVLRCFLALVCFQCSDWRYCWYMYGDCETRLRRPAGTTHPHVWRVRLKAFRETEDEVAELSSQCRVQAAMLPRNSLLKRETALSWRNPALAMRCKSGQREAQAAIHWA